MESIFEYFFAQEPIIQDPDKEHLAFLDRGVQRSLYFAEITQFVTKLQNIDRITAYPSLSEVPPIAETLSFLHSDITEACFCAIDRDRQTHWYGRNALASVQFWSATKFLALLYLQRIVTAATDPSTWRIVDGQAPERSYSFAELVRKIFTYEDQEVSSNALAAMFKNFFAPGTLENWLRMLTGNQKLTFRGKYGENPFLIAPLLQDATGPLAIGGNHEHYGENLVSAYDLTRALSQFAWQDALGNKRFTHGQVLIESMAQDTARYIDVALEYLGLQSSLHKTIILSKMGFGRSTLRNRSEITYTALWQSDQYACCFTLRGSKALNNFVEEARTLDARIATEVTKLIDWYVCTY